MGETNLNEQDAKIAQLLANGKKVSQIAKTLKYNIRTMEAKIVSAKKRADVKTLPHFVAKYLRKGLIK
jgi:DNA-binding CsgD family transcriptional regulator